MPVSSWGRGGSLGCAVLLALAGSQEPASAEMRMRVTADDGIRRTCPSLDCGVIGSSFPGESVIVYETVEGWSRVSGYYSAACYDGRSAFVDAGQNACTPQNGIRDGEFAEWMRSDKLSPDEADRAG